MNIRRHSGELRYQLHAKLCARRTLRSRFDDRKLDKTNTTNAYARVRTASLVRRARCSIKLISTSIFSELDVRIDVGPMADAWNATIVIVVGMQFDEQWQRNNTDRSYSLRTQQKSGSIGFCERTVNLFSR